MANTNTENQQQQHQHQQQQRNEKQGHNVLVGGDSMKAVIYAFIIIHAINSAAKSSFEEDSSEDTDTDTDTSRPLFRYSLLINGVICVYAIYALIAEIRFLIYVRPYLPPGSLGVPFLGSLPKVFLEYKGIAFLMLIDEGKKHGPIFLTSILNRRLITLANSAGLSWLWNNDRKSFTEVAWPPNISQLLGPNSAANCSGMHHRSLRRLMEPFYAPLIVKNYVSVITKTTDEELEKWHSMMTTTTATVDGSNDGFVSSEVFKLYALRLFMISSFGEVDDEAVMMKLHDDFKIWIKGFMCVTGSWRIPGWKFDNAMKARDRIIEICKSLVAKFIAENPEGSDRAKKTVIGKMVYSKNDDTGEGLTQDEILDNLLLLLFAGHDTTYASISTVLHHVTQIRWRWKL